MAELSTDIRETVRGRYAKRPGHPPAVGPSDREQLAKIGAHAR